MASVKVRNVEIGAGSPKICVPIIEKSEEAILNEAKLIAKKSADLVEWRVDWFEEIFDFDKVQNVLGKLREILEDCPILFTCRTMNEGGEISVTEEQYVMLNQRAVLSGMIDLLDVEMFGFGEAVKELLEFAHEHNVKVVGSNHDFHSTPEREEIIRRLVCMQKMGADIPKIAVMPKDKQDVLTLLSAAEEMVRECGSTPVVAISMGPQGVISRIAGKVFGSAMTFGTVGKASAPGQLNVEDLRTAMKIINWGCS